jgi:hypothetical protein
MAATQTPSPAGWYQDPTGHSTLRYWSGSSWTTWVHDPAGTHTDPLRGFPHGPDELEHLRYVREVFLPEARQRHYLSARADAHLVDLVTSMRVRAAAGAGAGTSPGRSLAIPGSQPAVARLPHPVVPQTVPRVAAPTQAHRLPGPTPVRPLQGPRVARHLPAPEPSPIARWWDRTRRAVGSDLAVHGLAYAGVLLFFIGAFGLVVFAFGDVAPTLRPVAEAVIALVPFGAAALLVRRGAVVVGRSIEVAGGLVLPVMVVTSFLDGVGMPPDLTGTALVLALTSLLALVALAYAAWSARHPASALRYLVAPVAWLAVAMAGLGLGPRDIPSGKDVATPSTWQVGLVALAVVATLALCRRWPDARLASPTRVAAVPGLGVVALLAMLSWTAEGWPAVPVLATGALVLVALDLLGDRVPTAVPGVAGPLWWALVTAGVALGVAAEGPIEDVAPVAVIAVVGFLAQLERSASRRRPVTALVLPAAGAFLAVVPTAVDPWWAVATCAAITVWAGVRRTAPPPALAPAAVLLDVVAAVAPALALAALVPATTATTAFAVAAGAVVAAALLPSLAPIGREPALWTQWARVAGAGLLVTAGAGLFVASTLSVSEQWSVVVGLALVTAAAFVVRLPNVVRPPVVAAAASMTAVWTMGTLGVTALTAVAVLGGAALLLVALAHTGALRRDDDVAASLGLTGHALGLLVPLVAEAAGWSLVLAFALATVGLAVTAGLGSLGRSPVASALGRAQLGWAPLVLTAIGLPLTVALGLDRAAVLTLDDPWLVLVPVGAALAYALLTHVPVPGTVRLTAAWSAWAAALLAPLPGADDLTIGVGIAAVPATVALIRSERRHAVMTWTAMLALAPAVGLLGHAASPWVAGRSDAFVTALTLLVVGGTLLLGATVADLRGRAREPRWRPDHGWALAPVVVGLSEVVAALAVTVALTAGEAGWIWAGTAAVLAVAAVVTRVGLLAGPAAVVGWVSFVLLAPEPVPTTSWAHLALVAVLLAGAEALTRWGRRSPWWARADVPLLLGAVPVAVTALAVSLGTTDQNPTLVAVGATCLLVGARLRRKVVAGALLDVTGASLVLLGAAGAGSGWLALALAALSAGLTGLAVVATGLVRTAGQVGGALAAAGACVAAADWLALGDQVAVDATVAGAGAIAFLAAVVAVLRPVDRGWVLGWGGVATGLVLVGGVTAAAPQAAPVTDVGPSWWVTAGVALVAAAHAVAARPVALPGLRVAAAVLGLGALGAGLRTAGADADVYVAALAVVSVVSALAVVAWHTAGRAASWTGPGLVFGGLAVGWGIVVAAVSPADSLLLVPALGAAAVQSAAAGVVLDEVLLRMAAPLLACGAWLAFALEALDGNPQWVTVPIGLAILAVVGFWRADRRQAGLDLAPAPVVLLEGLGVAFLVGSALVQAFSDGPQYAALVSAIGLGITSWGGITQVRRRLVTGAALAVAGLVILVGIPLVRLLPAWEGAALWLLVGGVGVALVLVATMLERGRAAVRAGVARVRDLTEGWE